MREKYAIFLFSYYLFLCSFTPSLEPFFSLYTSPTLIQFPFHFYIKYILKLNVL